MPTLLRQSRYKPLLPFVPPAMLSPGADDTQSLAINPQLSEYVGGNAAPEDDWRGPSRDNTPPIPPVEAKESSMPPPGMSDSDVPMNPKGTGKFSKFIASPYDQQQAPVPISTPQQEPPIDYGPGNVQDGGEEEQQQAPVPAPPVVPPTATAPQTATTPPPAVDDDTHPGQEPVPPVEEEDLDTQRQKALARVQDLGTPNELHSNWAQRLGMALLASTKLGPIANMVVHPKWMEQEYNRKQNLAAAEGQLKDIETAANADALNQQRTESAERQRLTGENLSTKSDLERTKIENQRIAAESAADIKRQQDQTRQSIAAQKTEATLRSHGYKTDETGAVIPLPYEEMSQEQQAVHDLKVSTQELTDARAALAKAQKDNIPMAARLAQQRILTAQQNAATAAAKLGLANRTFEAEYHGTDQGVPLAGAAADESGNPIGTKVGTGNKPTGQVASRMAQATAIKEAGDSLIKEIDAKKNIVGNLASYWDKAVNQSPIADPDAAGLMTSLSSFAALQPSLHGFRSHEALKEFANIIGGIPKNAEALKASIRSIQNTAGIIEKGGQKRQTVSTPQGGSSGGNAGGHAGQIKVQIPGHDPDWIPAGAKSQFLKDHPDGKVM